MHLLIVNVPVPLWLLRLWSPAVRCNEGRFSYFYVKFERCIESYVVTVYAVNDTGKIYNALRKFGTLEFVRCMGENVVNGVRSNEVRLY